jgi:hypothetical protein
MDIDPIVGPVDALRIPREALPVFRREHIHSFTNVLRLEYEAIVDHEGKEFIEGLFLLPDLPASGPQALEIRIKTPVAHNGLYKIQRRVDDIQTAMQSGSTSFQCLDSDDVRLDIGLPQVRKPASALPVFVFVA